MADFASLPPVHVVLESASCKKAVELFGHSAVVEAIREILANERLLVRAGRVARDAETLGIFVCDLLEADAVLSLRPVLNLTGVVLHTNLGRAQLPEVAIEAATQAMRHNVALEYNLDKGARGERDDHLRNLICELTGAEDATIVNNNAAAVLLSLNSLAEDRDVVISRGELIEIGGAFRIPDIMARAGCHLKEVGTTNRTHMSDYKKAFHDETALVLKVHTSNYRIEGFTSAVNTADLSHMAHEAGLPLLEDLGSGTLIDLSPFGLHEEPTVRQVIEAGADLVTFSGDKLLGGPQAGFIVGRADLIAQINRNPMKRAMRVDKIRLAALEAILRLYRNPEKLIEQLPTLAFLGRPKQDIKALAESVREPVQNCLGDTYQVDIIDLESEVGSGAMPTRNLPSCGLAITSMEPAHSVTWLHQRLRQLPLPIIGRIKHDKLLFDLRCLHDKATLLKALEKLAL